MDAHNQMLVAEKLLEQSIADHRAARANLNQKRNDLVIAKCQQSLEKLIKGYFLWHDEKVNPFSGHTPLKDIFEKNNNCIVCPAEHFEDRQAQEMVSSVHVMFKLIVENDADKRNYNRMAESYMTDLDTRNE